MHEIRVRNDYMGVLAEGPVSSISTDSRFGTLVGTIYIDLERKRVSREESGLGL